MIKVEHTTLACADPGTGRRRTGVAVVLLYVMIAGSKPLFPDRRFEPLFLIACSNPFS